MFTFRALQIIKGSVSVSLTSVIENTDDMGALKMCVLMMMKINNIMWHVFILVIFLEPWTNRHIILSLAEYLDQIRSVAQSCPTLCDPMNRGTPGLPVHHQLQEFTETHVHWVSDAIQPSHPLSSPSPLAPNPSQHQSLFQWVNSLHEGSNSTSDLVN